MRYGQSKVSTTEPYTIITIKVERIKKTRT